MDRAAILVEGESDREAVLALSDSRCLDLRAIGIRVVAMGGITNITHHIAELGPKGQQLHLTGLYDAAEERFVRRGLDSGGYLTGTGREGLAALGFHCCDRDLEDELIRALRVDRVIAVLEANRDLSSFEILQQQPAHRGRPAPGQLHRFFGAGAGRKIRYGRLLVEALEDSEIPPPLVKVLADALNQARA